MVDVLEAMSIRVEKIVISDLADETYPRPDRPRGPDARHEVDSRPSDAIALGVRLGSTIFATADVLDRAATSPDAEDDEEGDEAGGSPKRLSAAALEETGEPIDAARLDIFREFVNSLDPDQDQRGGASNSYGGPVVAAEDRATAPERAGPGSPTAAGGASRSPSSRGR